jgi:tripartite-type tricarboxylate transporter receptor subunit TctC
MTPKSVIDRLNAEITKITSRPDTKKTWADQGAVPLIMTVPQFESYLQSDIAKWAKIVKISGARPDQ